ncbi:hypothetical protein [Chitinophaga sp.]|uniref:hypothetical protein n=1 Tax=Chitinophaga sp. TaxID=1869181 RepID=UPI0031DCF015
MRHLIFIAGVIGIFGCEPATKGGQQQEKDTTQITQNNEKEVIMNNPELHRQDSLQGNLNDEGGGNYRYQEKDMDVALPIIAEILKIKGYQPPAKDVFQQKLHEIFAENFSAGNSCRMKEYGKFTMLWEGQGGDRDYEFPIMTYDMAASKEFGFITRIPLIASLGTFVDNDHFKVNANSAMAQGLVARNKYLFNDSKADLAILLNNDKQFLISLVEAYGYTKEPKINDLVMNEYMKGNDDGIKQVPYIIFKQGCNKQLVIREGLLNWIKEHTDKEEHRMLDAVYYYVYHQFENKGEFTLNEKRKMAAYVDNIFIPLKEKFGGPGWPTTELIFNLEPVDHGIQDYLKQQKYYNLPEVKKLYGMWD